jgi:hypothetical protein
VYSATILSVNKSNTNVEVKDSVPDESSSTGSCPKIYLLDGILPFLSV